MTVTPTTTGAPGSGGNQPALGGLQNTVADTPAGAQGVDFTLASRNKVDYDSTWVLTAGVLQQVRIQPDAFLRFITLDVEIAAVNSVGPATVKWNSDGPFNVLQSVTFSSANNLPLISGGFSGFKLAMLRKYLGDTMCDWDTARDAGYYQLPTAAGNGAGSAATNAGSARFRLVLPFENRARDAYGAILNTAVSKQLVIAIQPAATFGAGASQKYNIYATAPSGAVTVTVAIYRAYWDVPPALIPMTTNAGTTNQTSMYQPAGTGTLPYLYSETHTEVLNGGNKPFNLGSTGQQIMELIFTLRTLTGTDTRDVFTPGSVIGAGYANWPPTFNFYFNNQRMLLLAEEIWIDAMARFFGLANGISSQAGAPGCLDAGVFVLGPWLRGTLDKNQNFETPYQTLPTNSETIIRIQDSQWGASSDYLEVDTRSLDISQGGYGETLYA